MRKILFISLVITSLYCQANSVNGLEAADGKPFSDSATAWKTLNDFFGRGMPQKIIVNRKDFQDGNSKFNCTTNSIFINSKITDPKVVDSLIAHESTHIVLCRLTQEYNIVEKSRFWDEGLATIIQYRDLGKEDEYKKRSRELAVSQKALGNLQLAKIQDWHVYSRDESGKINGFAYGVGSNFNYFLIDTFGEKGFKKFLSDIGKTKDFNTTTISVFHKSPRDLEEMWHAYLKK